MTTRRFAFAATITSIGLLISVVVANEVIPGPDPQPSPTPSASTTLIPIPDAPFRIVRTVDGDTIIVRQNGADTTLRLIGVDTPETKHPTKGVECYGPDAATYAKQQLTVGERVTLTYGPQRLDRYGRTLAYVRDSDGDFGQRAIRMGYARQYRETRNGKRVVPNHPERAAYQEAERLAQDAKRGLWGACPT